VINIKFVCTTILHVVLCRHEKCSAAWLWCLRGAPGLWTKIGSCGSPHYTTIKIAEYSANRARLAEGASAEGASEQTAESAEEGLAESVESVPKKKRQATVGRICRKGRF